MAEYSREQRNQLSRAVANSETGSRQLKGVVDSRKFVLSNSLIPVVQAQTITTYATPNRRGGNSIIHSFSHERVDMTENAKNQAARQSGYGAGGAHLKKRQVCNHHVSYKMVRDQIKNRTIGNTIAATRTGLDTAMQNILGVTSGIVPQSGMYHEDNVNEGIDNAIAMLANHPHNLFYWPKNTGDQAGNAIDNPKGNPPINGTVTNQQLQQILDGYRQLLFAYL